jgi:hypothetical protein
MQGSTQHLTGVANGDASVCLLLEDGDEWEGRGAVGEEGRRECSVPY